MAALEQLQDASAAAAGGVYHQQSLTDKGNVMKRDQAEEKQRFIGESEAHHQGAWPRSSNYVVVHEIVPLSAE